MCVHGCGGGSFVKGRALRAVQLHGVVREGGEHTSLAECIEKGASGTDAGVPGGTTTAGVLHVQGWDGIYLYTEL